MRAAGLVLALAVAAPVLAESAPGLTELPPAVRAELTRAGLPGTAMSALVWPVPAAGPGPSAAPRLAWLTHQRRPVASLAKLFTTYTALDLLGPAWTWRTPVRLQGRLVDDMLQGDLVVQGVGDPSLSVERTWLLLQEVQRRGVRRIRGDIVLHDPPALQPLPDPAAFDGEPLRPYNVPPRSLLLALGSVSLSFRPEAAGPGHPPSARVQAWPPLDGVSWPQRVPLAESSSGQGGSGTGCGDWQRALGLDLGDPIRPRLRGRYPAACGERQWHLAWPDAADHARRLVAGLWQASGGRLDGQVRLLATPPSGDPIATDPVPVGFEFESPPLAEVVRSINKFSNNPMARLLFLALGGPDGLDGARRKVAAHLQQQAGCTDEELRLDNGSGLSRTEAASAACLAGVLAAAWASPVMPELLASLPVAAVDGTTRRMQGAAGRAHLKTGSLVDVAGVAGYVLGDSGQRWIVVGLINGPRAPAARAALDALVAWAASDRPVAMATEQRPGLAADARN